jgi:hypothetical protein
MTFDEKQKAEALGAYSSVMALYQVLRGNPSAIKVKRAIARGGEIEALGIDFLIDVEVKAVNTLSTPDYMQWIRLADTENYNLVPEENQIALGRIWIEYGMGAEGAYHMLYEKNKQGHSYTKGKLNGDGFAEPATD